VKEKLSVMDTYNLLTDKGLSLIGVKTEGYGLAVMEKKPLSLSEGRWVRLFAVLPLRMVIKHERHP